MLPKEVSLNVLTEFLVHHGYHKVKGVPIIFSTAAMIRHEA
jgi:hypothetical protein